VTSAIIGARNVGQLDDCLNALKAPGLDESTLAAIDAITTAEKPKHAEG
jgi:aryl-alcohol dehydrogenase-like predicted oxidoreductase